MRLFTCAGLKSPCIAGSNLAARPPSERGQTAPGHTMAFSPPSRFASKGAPFRPAFRRSQHGGPFGVTYPLPRSSPGRPSRPAPGHVTPCVTQRLSSAPRVVQRKFYAPVTFLGDKLLERLGDIRWIVADFDVSARACFGKTAQSSTSTTCSPTLPITVFRPASRCISTPSAI